MIRRSDALALLFLALAVGLLLSPALLSDRVLLPLDLLYTAPPWDAFAARFGLGPPRNDLVGDVVIQNVGWKALARRELLAGELPLWNPYVFTGMPFLAQGQYAVLYPLGFLFYLLPLPDAYEWFTALHLWLGGALMFAFLRLWTRGTVGPLVGGVTFALSSFLVVSFLWPQVVSTAVWLPALLLAIELVVRHAADPHRQRRALVWALVGAVFTALQFLAGHLEISFYLLFSAGFFALCRLIGLYRDEASGRPALRAAALLLAMVAVGTGLAAIQLVPFLELIQQNYRTGFLSYQEILSFALPLRHLAAFFVPDVFGNPAHTSYLDWFTLTQRDFAGARDALGNAKPYPFWGTKNYVEGAAYVGVIPLLLAPLAFLRPRTAAALPLAALATLSLLLAFGTPLYALFFFGVPGFDQLHTPFRWIYPFSTCVAVLAGLGTARLLSNYPHQPIPPWARRAAAGVATAGACLLLLLLVSRTLPDLALRVDATLVSASASLARAFPSAGSLYSYEARNLAILGLELLAAGGLALLLLNRRRPVVARLLPIAAALPLVAVLAPFLPSFNPVLLEFVPPSLRLLQSDRDLFRVVSFNYDDTLRPNTAMLVGLQDVRGYDTVIPARYVRFWSLLEEPQGLLYSMIHKLVRPESLTSPLLDLLNVKYVLTTQNIGLPGWREAYQGEINIYENEDVLPRAFVLHQARRVGSEEEALEAMRNAGFNPRYEVIVEGGSPAPEPARRREATPAGILSYSPTQVRVRANLAEPGYLVLTDAYFPGWRAWRDGEELPVLRAYSIFRAIQLPAGEQEVVFRYRPDSFLVGAALTGASGVVWLMGLAVVAWRRVYRDTPETTPLQRIAKNSLTPMATQILNRALDFGFAILMLRLLGPENAGKYAFAVLLIGFFGVIVDFGLGTLLTRDVAREPSVARRYLGNTILARGLLYAASMPLLAGVVLLYRGFFGLSDDTATTIALFALSLIPTGIAAALSATFQAHEKMEYPALVSVGTSLCKVTLGTAVLLLGGGIVGLGAVALVTNLFTAVMLYGLVRHALFLPTLEGDRRFQRQLLGAATPLMLNSLLSMVFFRADVMLLQPTKGDLATGYYTTAYKFLDGLNLIPSLFTLAIFPLFSRLATQAQDSLVRAFRLALKLLLAVSLPISVGTAIIAPQLIELVFGEAYLPSAAALQALIWFLPFSYVNSVTHYVLIAVNRQRFLTLAFVIGASFNVLANLVAIPAYGFLGAAVVTVLSELVLMVPFFFGVSRWVGPVDLGSLAWRPVLAAAVMGAILWWLRDLNLLIIIAAGALIYLPLTLLLRVFSADDLRLLRSARPGSARAAEGG